jgi:hypothetical protein
MIATVNLSQSLDPMEQNQDSSEIRNTWLWIMVMYCIRSEEQWHTGIFSKPIESVSLDCLKSLKYSTIRDTFIKKLDQATIKFLAFTKLSLYRN